jgi:hypothetical protein
MTAKTQTLNEALMSKANVHGEAMATFRHYDTLSATAVGAIPISFAGVCTILHNLEHDWWRGGIPFAGACLTFVFFMLYRRLDVHAATALNVAACLERGGKADGEDVLGLASTRDAIAEEKTDRFSSLKSTNEGALYTWVRRMTAGAIILLLALTAVSAWGAWGDHVKAGTGNTLEKPLVQNATSQPAPPPVTLPIK